MAIPIEDRALRTVENGGTSAGATHGAGSHPIEAPGVVRPTAATHGLHRDLHRSMVDQCQLRENGQSRQIHGQKRQQVLKIVRSADPTSRKDRPGTVIGSPDVISYGWESNWTEHVKMNADAAVVSSTLNGNPKWITGRAFRTS